MKSITIIGAGLAGTLLSLYMARRGYAVELFESRAHPRKENSDKGRSINLALSCRGITGLAGVDLMPLVEKIMVPMRARAIHEEDGQIKYQNFGRHPNEHINAILRSELNELLLTKAEENPQITLHFDMKLVDFDVHKKLLHFETKEEKSVHKPYTILIGADGAASDVREILSNRKLIKATRDFLPYGYKELSLGKDHPDRLVREHLHLWPRDSFMLLGNPNRDGSITGTLFLANQGKNSFAQLNNEIAVHSFFKEAFPDAYQAMPDLVGEFFENPTGHLSTINCSPWYYDAQCLLIGDAAHGVVPFFGQGMNSAFEDCRILDEMLDEHKDNWATVMPAFFKSRKLNTDAVASMSMDNYHEIQSDIRDEKFILKKQIEQKLMQHYPDHYVSKHVLVMFSNTPYAIAKALGEIQNALLNKIYLKTASIEDINWKEVDVWMNEYDNKLANFTGLEKIY